MVSFDSMIGGIGAVGGQAGLGVYSERQSYSAAYVVGGDCHGGSDPDRVAGPSQQHTGRLLRRHRIPRAGGVCAEGVPGDCGCGDLGGPRLGTPSPRLECVGNRLVDRPGSPFLFRSLGGVLVIDDERVVDAERLELELAKIQAGLALVLICRTDQPQRAVWVAAHGEETGTVAQQTQGSGQVAGRSEESKCGREVVVGFLEPVQHHLDAAEVSERPVRHEHVPGCAKTGECADEFLAGSFEVVLELVHRGKPPAALGRGL